MSYTLLLIGTGGVVVVLIATFVLVSWTNSRDARRSDQSGDGDSGS